MRKHLLVWALLLILAGFYPVVSPSVLAVPIMILLFVGWSTSWDILGGWAGQVSLGHVAFVGLGAYFVAIGTQKYGLTPWVAIMLAMLCALVLSYIWGRLTFRLQGVYFAMSTIAIAEMIRLIAIKESWLSGGATGVFIVSLPELFGFDLFEKTTQFYLALGFAATTLLILILLSGSRFGYQLRAIREDEHSAMAAGINPVQVKLKAFMLSACLTTFGGGIYGIYLSFMEPDVTFNLLFSIQIAVIAIVGGRGTLWGPAMGALVLIGASEMFRTTFAQANMLVYGILILVVMLFFPRGMLGEIIYHRIRKSYARSTQG